MILDAIHKLIEKQDLTKHESYECIKEIMSGTASAGMIASFLTALRIKGETIPEISGAALAMREMSTKIETTRSNVIDTCGTGGDGLGTFNISTAAAIIAASAGATVAKHGNRAVSSKSGSADVLQTLGVNIDAPKEVIEKCLDEIGIAFLYAPVLHTAMKYATPVRRELGIRTIFNILGPLTNPAGAKRQVLGVFRTMLTDMLANVLQDIGTERALVVHGIGGLDEISTFGDTRITELKNGTITSYNFHPESVGIDLTDLRHLAGGNNQTNAEIIRSILSGKKGAPRDAAALNAGAAIYTADIAPSIAEGVRMAMDALDSGAAKKKLQELIEYTQ
jgi:anthranilate phosphoribosyltransferase